MDLINSLQAALKGSGDNGFSVMELIAQAGLQVTHFNQMKIRTFLKGEIVAGRVESKLAKRPSICGMRSVPVYFPVVAKKGKKK